MYWGYRGKSAGVHLVASVVMALAALGVVYGLWYPAPLHVALGVTSIFGVILIVDVIIGPLLTFAVATPNKKSLKFDLFTIVVLQLAAFFYGIYVVAEGRPVWIVFNSGRFDLVQSYQVENPYKEKAAPIYSHPSWVGPKLVSAFAPEDVELNNQLTFEAIFAGVDVPQRPDLYVPYEDGLDFIRSGALPLSDLEKYNRKELVEDVLADWPDATAYLPMMAKVKSMTVLINKESGAIVAIVPLNPWN